MEPGARPRCPAAPPNEGSNYSSALFRPLTSGKEEEDGWEQLWGKGQELRGGQRGPTTGLGAQTEKSRQLPGPSQDTHSVSQSQQALHQEVTHM